MGTCCACPYAKLSLCRRHGGRTAWAGARLTTLFLGSSALIRKRDAGNRPLSHYAHAWLDGLVGQVKPRVLADYRANYRRYVAESIRELRDREIVLRFLRELP